MSTTQNSGGKKSQKSTTFGPSARTKQTSTYITPKEFAKRQFENGFVDIPNVTQAVAEWGLSLLDRVQSPNSSMLMMEELEQVRFELEFALR